MAQPQFKINPYISIGNETFADPRLSFTSAGVLAVLLAKTVRSGRNEWSYDDLPALDDDEAQSVKAALEELVSLGYLIKR